MNIFRALLLSAILALNAYAQTNDNVVDIINDAVKRSRAVDTNLVAEAADTNVVSIIISGWGEKNFNFSQRNTFKIPEAGGKATYITSAGDGSFIIQEPGNNNITYIKSLNNGGMMVRGRDRKSIFVRPGPGGTARVRSPPGAKTKVTSTRDGFITVWTGGGRTYTVPVPERRRK